MENVEDAGVLKAKDQKDQVVRSMVPLISTDLNTLEYEFGVLSNAQNGPRPCYGMK